MPSYSFECTNCKKTFIKFFTRFIYENEEVQCPFCKAQAKKVFSPSKFSIGGCPNTKS